MNNKPLSKYIHIMKYMGSKRELLSYIEEIILKNNKTGKSVLDLFAGTCSVGMCLRDSFPIYSNDVQSYSKVISEAVIQNKKTFNLDKDDIWNLLKDDFNKNFNEVKSRIPNLLKQSSEFINLKLPDWNEGNLREYKKFLLKVPSPESKNSQSDESKWLSQEYSKRTQNSKLFPYLQTTFLFGEMYFSLEQALYIDSIKYAIENLPKNNYDLKLILRAALLHSHSYASAGTGHFAQFRNLSTLESVKDVFIYRQKSVQNYFLNKAVEIIKSREINKFSHNSKSFSLDYMDILNDSNIMSKVGIIYADPPYSFVHYSRFYHATENICRYDYPVVKFKGRYRTDRHQSPFCIKTKVEEAFASMFKSVNKFNIPILISYSDTGMIKFEKISDLALKQGMKIQIIEVRHKHSTMGRRNDKNRDVSEKLILCV